MTNGQFQKGNPSMFPPILDGTILNSHPGSQPHSETKTWNFEGAQGWLSTPWSGWKYLSHIQVLPKIKNTGWSNSPAMDRWSNVCSLADSFLLIKHTPNVRVSGLASIICAQKENQSCSEADASHASSMIHLKSRALFAEVIAQTCPNGQRVIRWLSLVREIEHPVLIHAIAGGFSSWDGSILPHDLNKQAHHIPGLTLYCHCSGWSVLVFFPVQRGYYWCISCHERHILQGENIDSLGFTALSCVPQRDKTLPISILP